MAEVLNEAESSVAMPEQKWPGVVEVTQGQHKPA
jgi:hypothetical protein